MGLRKLRPTSPGVRHAVLNDFAEVTADRPERSLLESKKRISGRNNTGRITVWQRGGGHKRRYRRIDFRRDKDGIPANVRSIEYDPNRSAFIALLVYADGEKRYILAPAGLVPGRTVLSGSEGIPLEPGNAMPLAAMPTGSAVHNVELVPGRGGQLARGAGTVAVLSVKEGKHAQLTLPSGEIRKVLLVCRATLGQVGNVDHNGIVLGKAGRNRWRGRRPVVRGSAMNPVAHPMGGGEGRRAGGRHPVTPWGVVTKGRKTRGKRKVSNSLIVRRRRKRGKGK